MMRSRFVPKLLLAGAACGLLVVPTSAAPRPAGSTTTWSALQAVPPPPPPPSKAHRPAPPPARPAPPPPPPPPEAQGKPINVQIQLTVHEEGGEGTPESKTVILMAADNEETSIRSGSQLSGPAFGINVDARPQILSSGRVRLFLGLEYSLPTSDASSAHPAFWSLSERMNLILDNGKPLVVSRTVDPRSSRQMLVELTATILK